MREGVVVPGGNYARLVTPVGSGASRLLRESVGARLDSHSETLVDIKSGKPMNASRLQPSLLDPADCDAVLCVFYDFSKTFITTVSAHLWMLDAVSGRAQIVASYDESSGIFVRQFADSDIALESLESNTSILRSISRADSTGKPVCAWRYALPFDSGTIRGAVTLGIESDEPPEIERLEEAIGLYRTIFVATLLLHSAKARDDSMRILFQGIQKLDTAADSCTILHVALNHAMTLLKAHTGSIMLLDTEKQILRIAAAQGLPPDVPKQTSVAIGEGVSGWVAATGKSLVIEDVDPRGSSNGGRHGVLTALSMPIKDDSGLLGVLNIGRKNLESFQSHQREYLDMLVSHLAIALRAANGAKFSRQIHVATLKALALTLEMHYPYSVGGKGMVVEWSSQLGVALGMNSDELRALEVASVLYDIGIDFATFPGSSGGPLTTYERGLLMMHPLIAADILEKSQMMQPAIPMVLHHHEHFDGSGYAGKLASEDIPLGARILAVTDAFGAMTAQRPYRRQMEISEAVRELRRCSGTKFDPAIVELFVPMVQSEYPSC